MIYFVRFSTGAIKIGFTSNLEVRLAYLEQDYDEPVELLAAWEGNLEDEQRIHCQFAHLRFGTSEQFRPGSDLLAFIGCEDLQNDDGYDWCEPLLNRAPIVPGIPRRLPGPGHL